MLFSFIDRMDRSGASLPRKATWQTDFRDEQEAWFLPFSLSFSRMNLQLNFSLRLKIVNEELCDIVILDMY